MKEIWENIFESKYILIYGAHALGRMVYEVLKWHGYTDKVKCFVVTDVSDNDKEINGLDVVGLREVSFSDDTLVLIATMEKPAEQIEALLKKCAHKRYIKVTFFSKAWSEIRREYILNLWRADANVCCCSSKDNAEEKKDVNIFQVCSHKDKGRPSPVDYSIKLIQAGTQLADIVCADVVDNIGEHISGKNPMYCELTAIYWIWKNCSSDVVGVCHYRRVFKKVQFNTNTDVVLPLPIMNTPSVKEQYKNDHSYKEWQIMEEVLCELVPEYVESAKKHFGGKYYFGYNMCIARKDVFDAYCEWLFPILFEIEKRCLNKEDEYQNRYIGFLAERLTSLYFYHNRERLNIAIRDVDCYVV